MVTGGRLASNRMGRKDSGVITHSFTHCPRALNPQFKQVRSDLR